MKEMSIENVLDFERTWWKHAGVKEQAIKDHFDVSSTKYNQRLNQIIEDPEAAKFDPILVKRLKRLKAYRARQRAARLLGGGPS